MGKRKRIAMILRTNGFEYDDRVRKECISLSKVAEVMLYVTFENNLECEGVTAYGIPYKAFRLNSRDIFKSGKFLFIKVLEFYLRVNKYLKDYDVVWAHEEYTFLFPLLSKKKKIIWDLHEIPEFFFGSFLRRFYHIIENKCIAIIHTNSYRIGYQISAELIKYPQKHYFIRNFPDIVFLKSQSKPEVWNSLENWKKSDNYVYLQGISSHDRFPFNSLAAVLSATNYKIVIVGSFNDALVLHRLKQEFGHSIMDRLFFTGMIDQLMVPYFLKSAVFSMVFYQITTPNERFCEANRFYQSIALGVPVITGCNEPMAEFIKQYNCGISLASDGRNIDEIIKAIHKLLTNLNYYKIQTKNAMNNFVWNDQNVQYFCNEDSILCAESVE